MADLVKLEPDYAFWQGKSVFLTGHTGFKGSWLSLLLQRFGAVIHGYALAPPERFSLFEAVERSGAIKTSTIGDVRDIESLESALSASSAEVVFHMAAQPIVRRSYIDPVGTFSTNVMGTVHVLDTVRRQDTVRATVVVTSDKCYENREWFWGYREAEPMGGYDPYSSSKGCAELVTAAFRRSYQTAGLSNIGSGRAGNVIGGGDISTDRLVPDLIRSYRSGLATLIRNPDAVRPWQHVLEPLFGYMRLAEQLTGPNGHNFADGWNFGPDPTSERTVRDVADASCRLWGSGASWLYDQGDHRHEASYLKLDSSKARRLLGWVPVWGFEKTLAATIDWYSAESGGKDMLTFTQSQISDYLAAIAV